VVHVEDNQEVDLFLIMEVSCEIMEVVFLWGDAYREIMEVGLFLIMGVRAPPRKTRWHVSFTLKRVRYRVSF
jgi:hypothetical protein